MSTITPTDPFPNVPLPACASVADDWEPGPRPYRIILGPELGIAGTEGRRGVEVWNTVAQRTPAWIDLFAPLTKQCRDAITANPHLGRR
jgi:hypothetical protein